ncbi:hypothetical protein PAXRUDRAFT_176464, partial [Paxillus rubicundulus Ve08.2h10]
FAPKEGTNWGVEVTAKDSHGKIIYNADGKPSKVKIPMGDGMLRDGSSQPLYFPAGHLRSGVFKGMATILEERGYGDMEKVHAECPKFACDPKIKRCCCRRMLYNEPDFVNVKSNLELISETRGFRVLFLPNFYCELNFIEQCWGHSKRIYRQYPPSSKEEDLERNMIEALESVTITQMRKYARRSRHFMDAYHKGLSGQQAAWASKKYRGHRVIPNSILDELEKANIT